MLTKLLSSDSQQGIMEDKIVFQSTPRQLNKKAVSALSMLLSAAENKDVPPPPPGHSSAADSPFSTSSTCSQSSKSRPRSQHMQHQYSSSGPVSAVSNTMVVDPSRTFSKESKSSLSDDDDLDGHAATVFELGSLSEAFGSFSLTNSLPSELLAGREEIPMSQQVAAPQQEGSDRLEAGSYASFDSFSDIPMCESPAFMQQAVSFEYSTKEQTLPVLNATPNVASNASKLSCEELMKLILSFVSAHRSTSRDSISSAAGNNTSTAMSFALENSFLMQTDVSTTAKLARLQLFAAEEDGTPMDDLPGFSSATDILNLGVTDFVVVDRSTQVTLMHVRIAGNIDGKNSPFQGNTTTSSATAAALAATTGNSGRYRIPPSKDLVEEINQDFYTLQEEGSASEHHELFGSLEGEDSTESFQIEREDSCAADLITCFRTDTDEMKGLQEKATAQAAKSKVLENELAPIGEDLQRATPSVEMPSMRRQRSHSGNLMICCRRLNSEKWRVAKELKILPNGGVVLSSSVDDPQNSARSSNTSSKTTSPEKQKSSNGGSGKHKSSQSPRKLNKTKSSKSIPIAGALSVQVDELNPASIPIQLNTNSSRTTTTNANEGLERRHSERPYNEEVDEDASLDAYVRNWQMFGSGSRNSSFFDQSSNNSTPAMSLNPHTSSSFLAPFSPSNNHIRKTLAESSKSNSSKKSAEMSYDEFLTRIQVNRKPSLRNLTTTDDGKSSFGEGASTFYSVSDLALSQNTSSLVFLNDNESLFDDIPVVAESDNIVPQYNSEKPPTNRQERMVEQKKKSSSSMNVFTNLLESSRSPSLSPKEGSQRKEIIITGKEFKKKMPTSNSGSNSSAPNSPQSGSVQDANSCFEASMGSSSVKAKLFMTRTGGVQSNTASGLNSRTSTPTRNELLGENQGNNNPEGRRSRRGSSRDWSSWARVFSNVFSRTRGSSISSNTTDNQTAASTTSSATHAYDDIKGGLLTNASLNSDFESESMVFIEEGVEVDEDYYAINQSAWQQGIIPMPVVQNLDTGDTFPVGAILCEPEKVLQDNIVPANQLFGLAEEEEESSALCI